MARQSNTVRTQIQGAGQPISSFLHCSWFSETPSHFSTQSSHLLLGPEQVTVRLEETSWVTLYFIERTVETWRGNAEPEQHPGSQPVVQFCTFILCVLSASLRGPPKILWLFRPALVPSVSVMPFLANSGKEARSILFTLPTLGFCATYLFSGVVWCLRAWI